MQAQQQIPMVQKDMEQIDKLVVKALERIHLLPAAAAAASGFMRDRHARRFRVGGCGWVLKRSGVEL